MRCRARSRARRCSSSRALSLRARSPGGDIVLYGTSWCGFCKKARAWLVNRGVAFVERDIETEPGAAEELAGKAAAAGVVPRGVPVIDVRGQLILGFDVAALEHA